MSAAPSRAASHPQLGPFRLRTRADTANLVFAFAWMGLLALLLAAGLFFAYSGVARYVVATPLVALGLFLVTLGPAFAKGGVQVYESGLVVKLPLRREPRVVPLEQIASLRYSAVETRVNGTHLMLRKSLVLALRGAPPVQVSQQVPREDQTFDQVRDIVAASIAGRLGAVLRRAGEVPWVQGVRIAADGLRIEGTFVDGQAQLQAVPFTPGLDITFDDGACRLRRPGAATPFLTLDCGEENFYPGLLLIEQIAERTGR